MQNPPCIAHGERIATVEVQVAALLTAIENLKVTIGSLDHTITRANGIFKGVAIVCTVLITLTGCAAGVMALML